VNRARVRRLAATAIIGSLLAIQGFAASATAAIPSANAASQAYPYSGDHAAGFFGSFHLTDSSTLSRLYLRVDLVSPENLTNVYFKVTRNGADVTARDCGPATDSHPEDFVCTFKTVRNTDVINVGVAWDPGTAQSVVASFIWNSVGVPDNGDLSHGDDWDGALLTALASNDPDGNFDGGFTLEGDPIIANAPISATNVQAARIVGLPAGTGASVEDGPGVQAPDCVTEGQIDCNATFGEWVETLVGVGDSLTSLWQLQITYASGTPKSFVHIYTLPGDPETYLQEYIEPCPKKNPEYPCFTWSAKNKTATIFTYHNGVWKGAN
jgi:hypothetical protein